MGGMEPGSRCLSFSPPTCTMLPPIDIATIQLEATDSKCLCHVHAIIEKNTEEHKKSGRKGEMFFSLFCATTWFQAKRPHVTRHSMVRDETDPFFCWQTGGESEGLHTSHKHTRTPIHTPKQPISNPNCGLYEKHQENNNHTRTHTPTKNSHVRTYTHTSQTYMSSQSNDGSYANTPI